MEPYIGSIVVCVSDSMVFKSDVKKCNVQVAKFFHIITEYGLNGLNVLHNLVLDPFSLRFFVFQIPLTLYGSYSLQVIFKLMTSISGTKVQDLKMKYISKI